MKSLFKMWFGLFLIAINLAIGIAVLMGLMSGGLEFQPCILLILIQNFGSAIYLAPYVKEMFED